MGLRIQIIAQCGALRIILIKEECKKGLFLLRTMHTWDEDQIVGDTEELFIFRLYSDGENY